MLLTLEEFAKEISVSYWTARDIVLAGQIRAFKIGRRWKVAAEDIPIFLEGVRHDPFHGPKPDEKPLIRPKSNRVTRTPALKKHAWRKDFRGRRNTVS